jgi:hypothetical protein
MDRRRFLTSTLASAVAAPGGSLYALRASTVAARQHYELRRYELRTGPQKKLADDYFSKALVPGLNRLGISPVGVFNISIGVGAPSMYVLIPTTSAEALLDANARLEGDAEYLEAAEQFLNAPAKEPAYERLESSVMVALDAQPKLMIPPPTASHGPRVFELRTYESASALDHQRKVEQMNKGEVQIFHEAGFWTVFFGDARVGTRLPNITYMISYQNLAARDKLWGAFMSAPQTRTLFSNPRYAFEGIVSNVNNQILSPTAYSQI